MSILFSHHKFSVQMREYFYTCGHANFLADATLGVDKVEEADSGKEWVMPQEGL